ncbi:SDR family NAD(P)-dependent oxidoreductase [candidate division KSB1 bacterium]
MRSADRALITGGAGFIGSHLAQRLISRGLRVTLLDNFDPYYDQQIKRNNLSAVLESAPECIVEGDVRDPDVLAALFEDGSFDIVYHLAAKTGVRPSLDDPQEYFDVNVAGTINVLEACRRAGDCKLIFASSSSVYGNSSRVPFSEDHPADSPVSPYAASKRAAELICRTYHELYRLPVMAIRFFTVYGPRQRPDMAIYRFVEQVFRGDPVEIYGDGSMARDFTYIDDIIDGLQAALTWDGGFDLVNLGDARTVSVAELVTMIERISGRPADKRHLPVPKGDVRITFADISRAARLLGYGPKVPIEDGLSRFIDWFKAEKLENGRGTE